MKSRNLLSSFICVLTLLICNPSQAEKPQIALNINNASIEQLETMKGIGTHKARAIVEYRLKNGNFSSVEDLIKIKGIGSKFVANNRTWLSVQ
jgi:competence protein ComEA